MLKIAAPVMAGGTLPYETYTMNLSPTAAARAANRMHALSRIPRRRKLPAPTALPPALRLRLENAVEAVLAVRDAADPDPDLEPDADLEEDDDWDFSEARHHA